MYDVDSMTQPHGAIPLERVKPFLKWAGGKRQLLPELRRFVPVHFGTYHEPFLGSGALFFDLWRQGRLQGRRCRLADVNADLVGCYRALAEDVDAVLGELGSLARQHDIDGASTYYQVRDQRFNQRRTEWRAGDAGASYPADLAAMFIYLNRTGFNGLFRLNKRGKFNVPAGRYANPRICDEPLLRTVAAIVGTPTMTLTHATYLTAAATVQPGDFVYFDPPYVPLSQTARFTAYTQADFSDADQQALRDLAVQLARGGSHVLVSNSTAARVTELYADPDVKDAGFEIYRVAARRAINAVGSRRGEIAEYIISNIAPPARSEATS